MYTKHKRYLPLTIQKRKKAMIRKLRHAFKKWPVFSVLHIQKKKKLDRSEKEKSKLFLSCIARLLEPNGLVVRLGEN